MSTFQKSIAKAINVKVGSSFWKFYTITSSNITTTAQNLTPAATGKLLVEQVIVKTDATGLAGGTNFQILSNNAKGVANIFVETVANLGANITLVMAPGVTGADVTTSKPTPSVTALQTILEAGKKIQYKNTVAAGTGAGTIDIAIKFTRLDAGADIPDSSPAAN